MKSSDGGSLAALPQHTAEGLCLSGTCSLINSRLRLEHAAAEPQVKKIWDNGKPEAYRLVLRQSRLKFIIAKRDEAFVAE